MRSQLTIAAAAFAWVIAAWMPVPVLSLLGALPLLFWLPGAAALRLSRSTEVRRSGTDSSVRPTYQERSPVDVSDIAVTTALSAAITIAVGLVLTLINDHLPRVELVTVLAALTVSFELLAERMSPAFRNQPASAQRRGSPRQARWVVVPTIIACCFLVGLLGYLSWRLYVTPIPGDAYTVLSLDNQHGEKVIQVINHEATTMNFRLKVSRGSRIIANRSFQLKVGGEYRIVLPTGTATETEIARLMTEANNKIYRTLTF